MFGATYSRMVPRLVASGAVDFWLGTRVARPPGQCARLGPTATANARASPQKPPQELERGNRAAFDRRSLEGRSESGEFMPVCRLRTSRLVTGTYGMTNPGGDAALKEIQDGGQTDVS